MSELKGQSAEILLPLIQQAMDGSVPARHELADKVSLRLRAYIYRSTLDEDMTDDVLQETLIILIRKLGNLKTADAFWGWIFRVASNSIIDHYRKNAKHKRVHSFQDILIEKAAKGTNPDARLMNRELADTIKQAISALKPRQRQAISLRCYEDMSFREIALALDITEINARVHFHRGLEKVRSSLQKQGFTGSSLVIAITFFGKITATTEAAASATVVSAQTVSGGISLVKIVVKVYSVIQAYAAKTAAAVLVAAVIGVGVADLLIGRDGVRSVHYILLGLQKAVQDDNVFVNGVAIDPVTSLPLNIDVVQSSTIYNSKGLYEHKMVFPEGPDGPILRFMYRLGMDGKEKLCQWLQDGTGCYYYEAGDKALYITNDPLRVPGLVLPTDLPEMINFIYSQVGKDSRVGTKRGFFNECLNYRVDNRAQDYSNVESEYSYNDLGVEDLKKDWPSYFTRTIDKRDQMHKRGWTYYKVSGELFGEEVSGFGQVPFIYSMYQEHLPKMYLKIGDTEYFDFGSDKDVVADFGDEMVCWPENTLFKFLPRPWRGIAFIDSLCRDCARVKIPFDIELDIDTDGIVKIWPTRSKRDYCLVYDINRYDDVIRSIEVREGEEVKGKIKFKYEQFIAGKERQYEMPEFVDGNKFKKRQPEMWLDDVIEFIRMN